MSPGDRSRVGRSRGVATAGVRMSTTVGSTVMGRGQKGGADTVSQCRVQRGLVTSRPVAGRPRPARQGRSKKEGPPTARTGPSETEGGAKHQAGASGTEQSGKGTAPWTGTSRGCEPAPPHPIIWGRRRRKEKGRPLGQERPVEAGARPWTGSSRTQQKGGDHSVPAKGDGRLG